MRAKNSAATEVKAGCSLRSDTSATSNGFQPSKSLKNTFRAACACPHCNQSDRRKFCDIKKVELGRAQPRRAWRRPIGELVFRQNLIRAGTGASRFVPRIEKRTWTRLRVALRSAKVLFRRGPGQMRRSYLRMGEKLARIRQPDRNDDAARQVDPEIGCAPRLWSEFCGRGFPSSTQGACGLRGSSERIQRAYVSNGVHSPQ